MAYLEAKLLGGERQEFLSMGAILNRLCSGYGPYNVFSCYSSTTSVAVFLASEDSSYITGQTIYPDGGRMALNYTVPVAE